LEIVKFAISHFIHVCDKHSHRGLAQKHLSFSVWSSMSYTAICHSCKCHVSVQAENKADEGLFYPRNSL